MNQVYKVVTDKIIKEMETGNIPWRKPWTLNKPKNYVTKRNYNGINLLFLGMNSYEHPEYLSFKQAKELGGSIKKGEKGHQIFFWNVVNDKEDEKKKIFILRYYTVFNVAQCDGIDFKFIETKNEELTKAENIYDQYREAPLLEIGDFNACYVPSTDTVKIASINNFKSSDTYYATLFHELVHSTGHAKRLNRFVDTTESKVEYSKEELVAELGSAFLCAETGIDNSTLIQSAGYIKSWMKVLKENNMWVVQASSKAQKAVSYIMNNENYE